jgi:sec-independent protein translocase protein TatA
MTPSIWQIAIVLLLVVMLFGRGKISELMGDFARGIKSFKKGMQDEDAVAQNRNESLERKAEGGSGKDEAAKG